MKALLLALLALPASAEAPRVEQVEPPSWWAGHSIDPVRLLIRGRNLAGAKLEAPEGVALGEPSVSASGAWLFVDARIDRRAAPGRRTIKVLTAEGEARARFEVLARPAPEGRFQGFSEDDLIYLVLPDRFANGDRRNDEPERSRGTHDRTRGRYYHGGDLQGMIDRLPYLKDLGVTALWLTPIYDNTDQLYPIPTWSKEPYTDYHGYGPTDYYAVDEHYGDAAKLKELVEKAHAAGIKVIQDQIANHVGPRHPWVADPPTSGWFHGDAASHLSNTFEKWVLTDPYASAEVRRPVLDGWYFGVLPDLNQDDPETARYLIQNTLWWIGMSGLDGIRQDTLLFAPRPFWRDWMAAIKREHPTVRVAGEAYDYDPALVSYFQGGQTKAGVDTGVDALFDFPLMHVLRRVFAEDKPMSEVAAVLSRDHLYPDPRMLITLLGSQDEARFLSLPGADAARLKLAFAVLLTMRGIPLLYYGDEVAMRGGVDPDNRRDFPGGWREDPRDAFKASGRSPEEREVFDFVRRLARLRRDSAALRRGRLIQLAVAEKTYAFARVAEDGWALTAINNDDKPREIAFSSGPLGEADFERTDLLGGGHKAAAKGGSARVTLPARTAALFSSGGGK